MKEEKKGEESLNWGLYIMELEGNELQEYVSKITNCLGTFSRSNLPIKDDLEKIAALMELMTAPRGRKEHKVKIDVNDSGFPAYTELASLVSLKIDSHKEVVMTNNEFVAQLLPEQRGEFVRTWEEKGAEEQTTLEDRLNKKLVSRFVRDKVAGVTSKTDVEDIRKYFDSMKKTREKVSFNTELLNTEILIDESVPDGMLARQQGKNPGFFLSRASYTQLERNDRYATVSFELSGYDPTSSCFRKYIIKTYIDNKKLKGFFEGGLGGEITKLIRNRLEQQIGFSPEFVFTFFANHGGIEPESIEMITIGPFYDLHGINSSKLTPELKKILEENPQGYFMQIQDVIVTREPHTSEDIFPKSGPFGMGRKKQEIKMGGMSCKSFYVTSKEIEEKFAAMASPDTDPIFVYANRGGKFVQRN